MASSSNRGRGNWRYGRRFNASSQQFRAEAFGELMSDEVTKARVGGYLQSADRTAEEKDFYTDWKECKCRLHVAVKCGVDGAAGCRGLPHGTHPAIVGLYVAEHRSCTLPAGVRVFDKLVFDYVEGDGPSKQMRTKYMAGFGTSSERMGAGFCYSLIYPETFVVRAGRLLGPDTRAHRVLRYFLVFGLRGRIYVKFEEVQEGVWHLSRSVSNWYSPLGLVKFFLDNIPAEATIGASGVDSLDGFLPGHVVRPAMVGAIGLGEGKRFGNFVAWASASLGAKVTTTALGDFLIATTHVGKLRAGQDDVDVRFLKLGLLGKHFLRVVVASKFLVSDLSVAEMLDAQKAYGKAALAELSFKEPLCGFMDVATLPEGSVVRADMVEAFFGFLVGHVGGKLAESAASAVGVCGRDSFPITAVVAVELAAREGEAAVPEEE